MAFLTAGEFQMSSRAIYIVCGTAFILAASGSAFAADMPVKGTAAATVRTGL